MPLQFDDETTISHHPLGGYSVQFTTTDQKFVMQSIRELISFLAIAELEAINPGYAKKLEELTEQVLRME